MRLAVTKSEVIYIRAKFDSRRLTYGWASLDTIVGFRQGILQRSKSRTKGA